MLQKGVLCRLLLMPVMTSKLFHRYHNVMGVLPSWEVLKYAAFFLRHLKAWLILHGSVCMFVSVFNFVCSMCVCMQSWMDVQMLFNSCWCVCLFIWQLEIVYRSSRVLQAAVDVVAFACLCLCVRVCLFVCLCERFGLSGGVAKWLRVKLWLAAWRWL